MCLSGNSQNRGPGQLPSHVPACGTKNHQSWFLIFSPSIFFSFSEAVFSQRLVTRPARLSSSEFPGTHAAASETSTRNSLVRPAVGGRRHPWRERVGPTEGSGDPLGRLLHLCPARRTGRLMGSQALWLSHTQLQLLFAL